MRSSVPLVAAWLAATAGCHSVSSYIASDGGVRRDGDRDAAIADSAIADADATTADAVPDLGVDAASPDAVSPDTTLPDAASPDTTLPDAVFPDATLPDAVFPDATLPDATLSDAALPDAALPDAALSDVALADAPVASDAPVSDASAGCGPIVISEMMIDPDGPDPEGEWIELYNAGGSAIDLHQWSLQDAQATHVINSPGLSIAPGQYMVLTAAQSVVSGSYVYSSGASCSTEICFNNNGDQLLVRDPGGTLSDAVVYDTSFPYTQGQSMSIRAPCQNPAVAASWCLETTSISGPGKNKGTPGAAADCN